MHEEQFSNVCYSPLGRLVDGPMQRTPRWTLPLVMSLRDREDHSHLVAQYQPLPIRSIINNPGDRYDHRSTLLLGYCSGVGGNRGDHCHGNYFWSQRGFQQPMIPVASRGQRSAWNGRPGARGRGHRRQDRVSVPVTGLPSSRGTTNVLVTSRSG